MKPNPALSSSFFRTPSPSPSGQENISSLELDNKIKEPERVLRLILDLKLIGTKVCVWFRYSNPSNQPSRTEYLIPIQGQNEKKPCDRDFVILVNNFDDDLTFIRTEIHKLILKIIASNCVISPLYIYYTNM